MQLNQRGVKKNGGDDNTQHYVYIRSLPKKSAVAVVVAAVAVVFYALAVAVAAVAVAVIVIC